MVFVWLKVKVRFLKVLAQKYHMCLKIGHRRETLGRLWLWKMPEALKTFLHSSFRVDWWLKVKLRNFVEKKVYNMTFLHIFGMFLAPCINMKYSGDSHLGIGSCKLFEAKLAQVICTWWFLFFRHFFGDQSHFYKWSTFFHVAGVAGLLVFLRDQKRNWKVSFTKSGKESISCVLPTVSSPDEHKNLWV